MTLAGNQAVAPLVLLPCLAASLLTNNLATAQVPVKSQASVSRIATALEDTSSYQLGPSRLGLNAAPSKMSPRAGIRPSLVQLKNASPSTAIFIENAGQFDPQVRYQARIGRHIVWVTATGLVFDALRDESSKDQPSPNASAASASRPDFLPLQKQPDRAQPETRSAERLVFAEDFAVADRTKLEAKGPQSASYNYFQSRDPSRWRTNVHAYSEVVYREAWPGIDLRLYGNGPDLEQELIINPGGDLRRVQIAYRGIEKLNVAPDGSLDVVTAFGDLHETAPRVYQQIAGQQVAVAGRFKLTGRWSYSFEVGRHDAEYALVVDPTLLYSTFLGGSVGYSSNQYGSGVGDNPAGIAVDGSGNAYIAGNTTSTDFPTTVGAYSVTGSSAGTGFITKLNATGSGLVYSTYLADGTIGGIAVDSAGHAFVTGSATGGFPTTPSAYWPTDLLHACSSSDIFVTELNPAGSQLAYSTCFNVAATWYTGSNAIATDGQGKAYIAGEVNGLIPTTSGAYQRTASSEAAFAMVVDTTASGAPSLVYSTYLGSSATSGGYSVATGIALDSFGKIYLTGLTRPGFPTTTGAYQTSHAACGSGSNCQDAFVAKLDPSASGAQSLIYSTYVGGSDDDTAYGIAVDASGSAYITGYIAGSSGTFPVTPGAYNTSAGGDQFVAKLNPGGSKLVYSTYLGGGSTNGAGIAVDALGRAYVTGSTGAGFPVTADAFQSTNSGGFSGPLDAFISELNPAGSALVYSTYLGGNGDDVAKAIALDQVGDVYVTGWTSSPNFPVTPFAFQPAINPGDPGCGACFTAPADAFVTKFPLGTSSALTVTGIVPTTGGNVGTVSPQIFGTGFHAGATAKLSCGGQSAISGANLTVGPGGRLLNTTFDLTGALPGKCDVVVTNPDGTSVALSQAFTVQQGGLPNIKIYLTGVEARKVPPEVSLGPADAVVLATVSNAGSVDSAPALVSVPINAPFSPTSTVPQPLVTTNSRVAWITSSVGAGASQVLTTTVATATSAACGSALWGPVCLTQNLVATVDCIVAEGAGFSCGALLTACSAAVACMAASGLSAGAAATLCLPLVTACLRSALYPDNPNGCVAVALDCVQHNSSCTSSYLPCDEPKDPNGMVGPPGVGGQRWMAGSQALSYVVSFSNEPTATVPAQQVVVTQPLGPNVNLSTLALLGITVPNGSSDVQVPVPAGSFNPAAGVNEFTTNVDLRPNQSLLVNVDAKLNPAAQTLTWTLTSIDPATGLPPFNPLVGFLPPGAGANVSFSVTPTPGLATGTQVAQQATVVFDGQTPMSTAIWANTIDNANPISHVSALPATSSCPNYRVSWSGSDVGSGLQGFTIYVSDTGGPLTPWLSNTTAATGTFTGAVGHTYSFYSVATDLTGNVEAAKTSAEASTSVTAASSCGAPSLSAQALNVAQSGTTVTANLQLTNAGFTAAQTVSINQITLRTLSGTGAVTLSSPTLPFAVGSLAIGATATVPLTLNVPATVTRFSVTEGGTIKDASGNGYSFSMAQTIIP